MKTESRYPAVSSGEIGKRVSTGSGGATTKVEGGAGTATVVFAVLLRRAAELELGSGTVWSMLLVRASVPVGIGSASVATEDVTTASVGDDRASCIADDNASTGNPASSSASDLSGIGVPLRIALSSAIAFEQHGHTGFPFIHPGELAKNETKDTRSRDKSESNDMKQK